MIRKWVVENYKSVKDQAELDLKPLTIVVGSNSSGKSSFIQSVLLVAQSLTSPLWQRAIILNGTMVTLGTFDDIRTFDGGPNVKLSWLLDAADFKGWLSLGGTPTVPFKVRCDVEFGLDLSAEANEIAQLNPQLKSCRLAIILPDGSEESFIEVIRNSTSPDKRVKELGVPPVAQKASRPDFPFAQRGIEFDVRMDERTTGLILEDLPDARIVGASIEHFVPDRLSATIPRLKTLISLLADPDDRRKARIVRQHEIWSWTLTPQALAVIRGALTKDLFDRLDMESVLGTGISVRDWTRRVDRLEPTSAKAVRDGIRLVAIKLGETLGDNEFPNELIQFVVPGLLGNVVRFMNAIFGSTIRYLGPLREYPKSLYPLNTSGSDLQSVGLRGELAAAVFNLYKNTLVEYVRPPVDVDGEIRWIRAEANLETAVLEWLKYLDLIESVAVTEQGKLGHQVMVTTDGAKRSHDLTHVGVGVSQVFPVVVMCLLSNANETLIFEQPELHLHPRVQARLGDFFVAIALKGVQCIVETHSEHIVNRLRYRIAEAGGEKIQEIAKIYFVERERGASKFLEIDVNSYGAITNWPKGFFDQTQIESEKIIRAALKRRTLEKEALANVVASE